MSILEETTPFFSIVIPAYNAERCLDVCVSSVFHADVMKVAEVIIIDDCSTDQTADICKKLSVKYDRVSIHRNNRNLGVGLTRNKGISMCRGAYICFLDSDDYFGDFKLDQGIVDDLQENKYDLVFMSVVNNAIAHNLPEQIFECKFLHLDSASIIDAMNEKQIYPNEPFGYFFKLEFLNSKKLFFPDMRIEEDQIFMCSVVLNMETARYIPEMQYIHTINAGGLATTFSSRNVVVFPKGIDILRGLHLIHCDDEVKRLFVDAIRRRLFKSLCYYIIIFHNKQGVFCYDELDRSLLWVFDDLFARSKPSELAMSSPTKFLTDTLVQDILGQVPNCLDSEEGRNYVYCLSDYSAAVVSVLMESGLKIESFIDDNRSGNTSFRFRGLSVQSFDDVCGSFDCSTPGKDVDRFFVCHQSSSVFEKIKRALLNAGVGESSVVWVNFDPVCALNNFVSSTPLVESKRL